MVLKAVLKFTLFLGHTLSGFKSSTQVHILSTVFYMLTNQQFEEIIIHEQFNKTMFARPKNLNCKLPNASLKPLES